jgi:hypothetical protein
MGNEQGMGHEIEREESNGEEPSVPSDAMRE